MKLELYTKARCSLCDEARALIEDARRRHPFELEEHDIRSSPALYERFRYDIPVVAIDGEVALRLHFTAEQLERLLD